MAIFRTTYRLSILSMALLSAACSPNRLIGNQVNHFSLQNVFPVVMKTDDIPMVCHANETNTPLLMSFAPFGVDVNMLLAFGYSGASACTASDFAVYPMSCFVLMVIMQAVKRRGAP